MLTIEEMLAALAPFGLTLAPGITAQTLLDDFARLYGKPDPRGWIERSERGSGYEMLLFVIGQNRYVGDPLTTFRRVGPYCAALWHFDAECVEDPDTYVRIAQRAALVSGGDLVFDDVRGEVDDDTGWLELTWRGRTERFEPRLNGKWVDGRVLEIFERYLLAAGTERRFAIHVWGQAGFIICQTPESVSRLNAATGLNFRTGLGPAIVEMSR